MSQEGSSSAKRVKVAPILENEQIISPQREIEVLEQEIEDIRQRIHHMKKELDVRQQRIYELQTLLEIDEVAEEMLAKEREEEREKENEIELLDRDIDEAMEMLAEEKGKKEEMEWESDKTVSTELDEEFWAQMNEIEEEENKPSSSPMPSDQQK